MRPLESFVAQPIRSLQTMLQVIATYDDSPIRLIPDGIYGPETTRAVSLFQRKHGLPVTGVTNDETWQAVVRLYEPALVAQNMTEPLAIVLNSQQTIHKGERNHNLYIAQGILTVLSEIYQSVSMPSLSGVLDEATAESLASFQQLSGLPMTGELDRQTWKHLALHYPLATAYRPGIK